MWDEGLVDAESDAVAEPRVLVAVITRPRDWETVQRAGWYRVPLARAPRRLYADYLAFYHTAAFPELRWTITFYAPIERYSVLRRVELLPDEPTHPRAQERYYQVILGPLMRLPRPIPSRRLRRVAFIHTTLARLLAAREINDLWEHGAQQVAVRRALETRESAARKSYRARLTLLQSSIQG